jgi:hypothetical protein
VSAALASDRAAPSVRALDALLDERIEVVGCPHCSARSPQFWGATGFAAISRSTRLVGSWPTSPA